MSFKPYRATFRVCSWPDQARDALGHLQLRCLPEYLSVYELCDSLYAHFSDPGWWTVACLPVHISRRPVGAIDPRQLLVQDLGLEHSHRQHFPKPRRLRGEGSAVQEDAWLDVLDALGGPEQSEESGDDDDEGQEEGEGETYSEQAEDESVEGQATQSSDSDLDSASHSETSGVSGSGTSAAGSDLSDECHSVATEDLEVLSEAADLDDHAALMDVDTCGEAPEVANDPPQDRRHREPECDGIVHLPQGCVRLYLARREVVAHCNNPAHGNKCRLSRKLTEWRGKARLGQGRPLGLLVAWLQLAIDPRCDTTQSHVHIQPLPSFAERVAARAFFKTLPGSEPFLQEERPCRDGEEEEPEFVP